MQLGLDQALARLNAGRAFNLAPKLCAQVEPITELVLAQRELAVVAGRFGRRRAGKSRVVVVPKRRPVAQSAELNHQAWLYRSGSSGANRAGGRQLHKYELVDLTICSSQVQTRLQPQAEQLPPSQFEQKKAARLAGA